ncbi:Monoglyceride lipase [Eptesipox virus]|uniref:Monoglyceride lipase n=1 Tax=Eptesipox virus TaxID=1329402 RepID=A0A220T682_9POXV|nr:esterase/lipase [Eptesipox virus]ASK51215.1 Monoglyceride lipase [Eptesipox virus]WAH70973.1 monoglyceride lipase [Eptesipox virus]
MTMIHYFINEDGQYISCQYWNSTPSPSALLFISHAAAEHCKRYANIATSLQSLNIMVFSHDHVGHGRSQGDRMYVSSFNVFPRDIIRHVDIVKKSYPNIPVYILGHSMGGTAALLAISMEPNMFAGLILLSPLVVENSECVSSLKLFTTKVLKGLAPNVIVGKINSEQITRNKLEVSSYNTDPYVCNGNIKVAFAAEVLKGIHNVRKIIHNISLPMFILHGTADYLCDIQGVYMLMEVIKSSDKTLRVYQDAYHSLHIELPDIVASVLSEINKWLEERITNTNL